MEHLNSLRFAIIDILGGVVMVPSAIVYVNPFTVFPADDEANAGFLDMTKPPANDPTKPTVSTTTLTDTIGMKPMKEEKLKMKFETHPAGVYKKPFGKDKIRNS